MDKKRVLLHICCGPCAIYPLTWLKKQGYEVVGLYYNPNIHPLQEYVRRKQALQEVAARLEVKVIFKDEDYDPGLYLRQVVFREENRCFYCYQMRLERAAAIAKRGNFDYFTTTLLYSKFQKHDQIAGLGRDLAGSGKVQFLYVDFRQGWKQGIEISKEWKIYRQQYCGCIYSEFERYKKLLTVQ
jgi:hypothetical protein